MLLYTSDAVDPVNVHALFASVPPGTIVLLNGGGDVRGIGGFFGLHGVQPSAPRRRAVDDLYPLRHRPDGGMYPLMRELRDPQPGGVLLARRLAQALLVKALLAQLAEKMGQRGGLAGLTQPAIPVRRDGQSRRCGASLDDPRVGVNVRHVALLLRRPVRAGNDREADCPSYPLAYGGGG